MIALVLLIYDFALTFQDEAELVWHRKQSLVSAILILNRIAAAMVCLQFALGYIETVRERIGCHY